MDARSIHFFTAFVRFLLERHRLSTRGTRAGIVLLCTLPRSAIYSTRLPLDRYFRSTGGKVKPEWLTYDIPRTVAGRAWKGRYRGQKQKWYAVRFTGKDSEINVASPAGHKAEFVAWR